MKEIDYLAQLPARFPRLFQTDFVAHGTISAGWVEIVNRLMSRIDAALDDQDAAHFEVRQIKQKFGALRFYWALHDATITTMDIIGMGRFQIVPEDVCPAFDQIHVYVKEAEAESETVCETCGQPGRLRVLVDDHQAAPAGYLTPGEDDISAPVANGWLTCLCEVHAVEAGRQKNAAADSRED